MSKSGFTLLLAILIAVGGSVWFLWRDLIFERAAPAVTDQSVETPLETVNYQCEAGASITARFSRDLVSLSLSDGRSFTLPQIASAPDARYTNEDGTLVFSAKDFGAFLEENGTTTYASCVLTNSGDLPY